MLIILACFAVLLWFGKDVLGWGSLATILGMVALSGFVAFFLGGIWPALWLGALAVLDCCLMLWIFGRDIRIR